MAKQLDIGHFRPGKWPPGGQIFDPLPTAIPFELERQIWNGNTSRGQGGFTPATLKSQTLGVPLCMSTQ